MATMKSTSYEAVCLQCYSQRSQRTNKRDAERWATGHMNAFGHRVVVQFH